MIWGIFWQLPNKSSKFWCISDSISILFLCMHLYIEKVSKYEFSNNCPISHRNSDAFLIVVRHFFYVCIYTSKKHRNTKIFWQLPHKSSKFRCISDNILILFLCMHLYIEKASKYHRTISNFLYIEKPSNSIDFLYIKKASKYHRTTSKFRFIEIPSKFRYTEKASKYHRKYI